VLAKTPVSETPAKAQVDDDVVLADGNKKIGKEGKISLSRLLELPDAQRCPDDTTSSP
jgi:hypothetical protein